MPHSLTMLNAGVWRMTRPFLHCKGELKVCLGTHQCACSPLAAQMQPLHKVPTCGAHAYLKSSRGASQLDKNCREAPVLKPFKHVHLKNAFRQTQPE